MNIISFRTLTILGSLLCVTGVAASGGCASGGTTDGSGGFDDSDTKSSSNGATASGTAAGMGTQGAGGLGLGVGAGNSGSGGGGGDVCGRQNFDIKANPVDILLVLDRSASMEDDPSGGSSTPSKWDIVVPSLEQVITATNASILWGLKVFPEGEKTGACTTESFPADILVPVAANNATMVNAAIATTTDHGDGTPTGDAINKAVEYLSMLNDGHAKYMVLATDGDPSCPSGDAAETAALQAVTAAATAGYHTFVVGIASSSSKVKQLNAVAVAGLEPNVSTDPTAPQFYLVSTQAQFVTSLQGITGAAATCVFPLSSAPPNPDHVGVLIGTQAIAKDTTNTSGWDYTGPDMKTIQIFGAACDQVKTQGASMVQVVFGCKNDPLY